MDFQTDCGLFEEHNNQEVFTSPVKDSCFYLTNEDSGLGMDIVSSTFFYYLSVGLHLRRSACLSVYLSICKFAMFVKCLYNVLWMYGGTRTNEY